MAFQRNIWVWLSKVPVLGNSIKFPLKVYLWDANKDNQISLTGITCARMTTENAYKFFYMKHDTNQTFDLPPQKFFQADKSIHLVRMGRNEYKLANPKELIWKPLEIEAQTNGSNESFAKLLIDVGEDDLAKNVYTTQVKNNFDRFGLKPSLWVTLAPWITIMVVGLAVGLMYYLAFMNTLHVTGTFTQIATPSPIPKPPF